MSVPATPASPPATVPPEGVRAYVGYRWRGGATLRLPSGAYVHMPSPEREVAAAVLEDHLDGAAPDALLEHFGRDWVARRGRGEFVWPVAAVDEWLATNDSPVPAPRLTRVRSAHRRLHTGARHLFAAPFLRAGPTPSPRGGH